MWVSERECSCTWCWAWGPNSFGGSESRGHWVWFWSQTDPRGKEVWIVSSIPQSPSNSQRGHSRQQHAESMEEVSRLTEFPPRVVLQQCSDLGVREESVEEARRGVETEGDFQTGMHLYWTNTKEDTQAEATKTRSAPATPGLGTL